MPVANPQVIRAGEDCWIEARNITDVRTGNPIDVTGFAVKAVARALYQRYVLGRPQYLRQMRYRLLTPVISTWSTSPTGNDGTILAGAAAGDAGMVQIHVNPTQTLGWRAPLVIIQAELTDPNTMFVSRIVDEIYEVNFDAIQPLN